MLAQIIKFFSQFFSKADVVRDHEKSSNVVPHSDEALELFLGYLKAEGATRSTLKNYSSDISQFVATANKPQLNDLFDISQLELFFKEQESKGLKYSSIQRKFASIKQFAKWLSQQGFLDPQKVSDLPFFDTGGTPQVSPATQAKFFAFKGIKNFEAKMQAFSRGNGFSWITALQLFVLALFSSFLVLFGYKQFFSQALTSQAFPDTPTRPSRILSFQGRLTDTISNPITTATNLSFKLFNDENAGSELWASGTCSIDPDQDGIFNTLLGSTCGSELDASVFSENQEIWLEVTVGSETLAPRQRIATVAYALNAETLQGFPIDATVSATRSTVAVMNEWGEIVLGENSPKIKSVSGNFTIEGEAITFQTAPGSNGNIIFDADGVGGLISQDLFSAPAATLSANYAGGKPLVVRGGPSGTANLTEWQNAAGSVLASVDASGNLNLATGNAYYINNASVLSETTLGSGVVNSSLTSVGALSSGSIASGFGTISTANTITGTVLNGTTGINTGAGAGTQRIDSSGNLTNIGTTQFNGITYTWPGADGTAGQVLSTNGSGTLSWTGAATDASIHWTLANGALFPKNSTVDFLIGGQATASAKFAVLNVNSGTPTATLSGSVAGNALSLTGDGTIQTSLNRSLILNPNGGNVGIGTASPTEALHVNGNIRVGQDARLVMNGASTYITHNGTTWLQPYYNSGYNTAIYSGNSGTTPKMVILSGGNVGIGDTTPAALFTVGNGDLFQVNSSGNVIVASTIGVSGDTDLLSLASNALTVNGSITATSTITGTTLNGTTGINTGAGAGTQRIDSSGNLTNIGTTQFNGITYTWPGADGTAGQVLSTNGSGTLSWTGAATDASIHWTLANGALFPKNSTVDFLIGGQATSSAKFAVLNVDSGTPTASVSAGATGAIYITAAGTIQTTNNQNLTIGGNTTGNIFLLPRNSAGRVGINTTSPNGAFDIKSTGLNSIPLTVTASDGSALINILEDPSGNGYLGINDAGGTFRAELYAVGNAGQLALRAGGLTTFISANSDTYFNGGNVGIGDTSPASLFTVGSGDLFEINSSGTITDVRGITNTGAITSTGGIFSINDSSNFATNINTGTSTGALSLGGGSGTIAVNSTSWDISTAGVASGFTGITSSGTITFSGLSDGIVKSTSGVLSGGNLIDLTADVTGILPIANGGTNANSIGSAGSVAYSTGTAYAFSSVGLTGECLISGGTGAPTWGDCDNAALASKWNITNGTLTPINHTLDLLVGGGASDSAKFAVLNVNSGTPTATISGSTTGNALSLTGDGVIATTLNRSLVLNPNGGNVGIGTSTPNTFKLQVAGNIGPDIDATYDLGATSSGRFKDAYLSGTLHLGGSLLLSDNRIYQTNDSLNLQTNVGGLATTVMTLSNQGYVGIGDTTPTALFTVGNGDLFQIDGSGNITTTGDLAVNGGDITSTGSLTLTPTSTLTLNSTGNLTLDSSADIILDADGADWIFSDGGATIATFTNSSTDLNLNIAGGQLVLANTNTINIGGTSNRAYNSISDSTAATFASSDNDLYVEDILEVGTALYVGGKQISSNALWQNTLNVYHPGYEYAGVADLAIGGTSTASAKLHINATTGEISGNGTAVIINDDIQIKGGDILGNSGSTRITVDDATSKTIVTGSLDVTSVFRSGSAFQFQVDASGNLTTSGSITTDVRFAGNASDTNSTPSFTWAGDTTTGMYRTGASAIAWSLGGTQRMTLSGTTFGLPGVTTISASSLTTFTASANLSFGSTNLTTTGNITGAVLNGTTGINTGASAGTLRINASGDLLNIRAITSNSSAPSTGDLGLYSSGSTNWMRFTSNNGIFKWYSDYTEGTSSGPTANSEILALTPTGQLIGNAGTAAAPTFTFEGSTTTGMYLPAASQLAWSTGGTQRMLLTSTGLAVTGAIDASTQFLGQASDGVTTPSFSWTGDTTTGMYRTGASAIAWSLGGTQRMTLSGTTFGLPGVTTLSATSLSTINAASSLSISSNVSVNTLATANDTGGVLAVGRQNNVSEGGHITLVGSSTNPNWEIDSNGANFRIFTSSAATPQMQVFNAGTGLVNLNVLGGILTNSVQRLTSAGALTNITTISASGNITTSARFYGAGDGVGSVSAPTYSFSGATNYGMFFTTTGPTGMVFTTAGSESFRVTGSGVILTPQTADGAVCNANNEGKVSYDADGSMEGRLFVCHSWGGGFRWTWLSYNTGTNPDLAENTRVNDLSIEAGDLVGVSDEEITTGDIYYRFSAQKATKTNAAKGMLGVISTKPGILLGEESTQVIGDHSTDPYLRPLTLAGRVPVKVVTQQKIEKGDRIGVSSYAGVGEVLTSAGHSVGSSLTTFDPATATCQNVNSLQDIAWSKNDEDFNNCYRLPSGEVARKIMVMVNNEYYYGDIALNDDGLILSNYAIQSQEDQQQTIFQLVEQSTQNIIQKVSTFSELLVANIQAGLVKSQQLNTNLIAPLDQQDLRVMIGNNMMPGSGKFVIENRNQQEVFSIDEQGTATLSGNLNVNQDASISGQLTATSARLQQLESRLAEIDQLKVNTATISGQLYLADGRTIESMLADNANFLATQSAAPQEVPAGSYDNFLSQLTGANDATIADLLATLYQEENIELTSEDVILNADGVFIHQYLGVRGLAQLETAQVSGLLTVGGNLLISNNSIATLSDTLEIQPTGNGTIRLLAGLMTLSDTGHVVINGDLTVTGTLAAGQLNTNTLQPDTFGEDLQVKLATTSAVLGESIDSQVSFTNQDNETVASINAEGSGRFRQLITQGVILASDEDAANATAGKQTLAAGQTEMVINNNTITEESLIYITPTSDTQNQVLFVKAKEACTNQTECQKNFTVGINAAITQAIEFNYWIVAVQP